MLSSARACALNPSASAAVAVATPTALAREDPCGTPTPSKKYPHRNPATQHAAFSTCVPSSGGSVWD
jgi:hypothetical protein